MYQLRHPQWSGKGKKWVAGWVQRKLDSSFQVQLQRTHVTNPSSMRLRSYLWNAVFTHQMLSSQIFIRCGSRRNILPSTYPHSTFPKAAGVQHQAQSRSRPGTRQGSLIRWAMVATLRIQPSSWEPAKAHPCKPAFPQTSLRPAALLNLHTHFM